jgi:hypothetical protein
VVFVQHLAAHLRAHAVATTVLVVAVLVVAVLVVAVFVHGHRASHAALAHLAIVVAHGVPCASRVGSRCYDKG